MTRFGRYELLRRLASGGMGEVFLAREAEPPGRLVVIKRVLRHLAEDPQFVDLFVNEARVSARLTHPNIARTLEFGEVEGVWFLAIELVDGVDLASLVATHGALAPEQAARLVAPLAGALAWAHGLKDEQGRVLGVVHGDLSPRNALLARDGTVKLIDFGLSKLKPKPKREPGAIPEVGSPDGGDLSGTLGALAPEQVEGHPPDAKTDQFGLGTLLYELLAGRPLFDGESDLETLAQVTACRVELPLTWPEPLRALLTRMLARAPAERFDDCGQVQAALEEYLADAAPTAPGLDDLLKGLAPLELPAPPPPPPPRPAAPEVTGSRLGILLQRFSSQPRLVELLAANSRDATSLPTASLTDAGAVLDWVLAQLTPEEHAVVKQLAALAKPHSLEDLEGLLDLAAWPGVWAVDVLQSLLERSLVLGFDLPGGERHFTLEPLLEARLTSALLLS
jgi:serine/threonine protein kinase